MVRASSWKGNFSSGALSELLEGRIDTAAYQNGATKLENIIALPQGPALNRPGTEYIDEVRDSSKPARFIPFVFNNEQAYTLCLNDGYIRFFADQQIVGGPYEITHPYADAELSEVHYAQVGDTMYLTHKNHKPRKLVRSGHTSWALSNYAPTADPFTASGDYPASVTVYEQRLIFGYTDNDPQTIWSTKAGDYNNMTVGTADTDAFKYTLGTRDVNTILWVFADEYLLIGTLGGIFVARGSGYDQAITPTNIQIKRHIAKGACAALPTLIGEVVLFISRLCKKLHGMTTNASTNRYQSREATLRNPDIAEDGITRIVYQEEPNSIAWIPRADGALIGATMEFSEEVTAWHHHFIAGSFGSGNAVVEDVNVIPTENGDELWLLVKRTINGGTKRYVELLKTREEQTVEDCFFLDSGLTYDGAATSTLTGLSHLEGETVSILGDGTTHPDRTVSSGQISLDRDVEKAVVGLSYNSTIKTLPLINQSRIGSGVGKQKRINKLVVRFRRTIGAQVGGDEDHLDDLPFRDSYDNMDEQVALFTGDMPINPNTALDTEGRMVIRQSLPLPMTVIGLEIDYIVGEH